MPCVFLGLGTNVAREQSMCAGLDALKVLDFDLIISRIYESEAVGVEGKPFYNSVVQLNTGLPLIELIAELKTIEDLNGRNRSAPFGEGEGLDIDVLTYGDLVGNFDGIELPRPDITRYAHVLLPLSEIAPDALLPGTKIKYKTLWQGFDDKSACPLVLVG